MSKFVTEGKVFNAVAVSNANVYTSDDVQVYNPNRRADSHTTICLFSTRSGTVDIQVQMEQGGAWMPLVLGDAVTANVAYFKDLSSLFYAVRAVYTNGSGSGTLNGWILSV
jgi:hypothetical protein